MNRLFRPTLLATVVALGACGGGAMVPKTSPTGCTFANPLVSGQDPWVVRQGGYYYYAQSRDNGIWIAKSATLTDVGTANTVKVWSAPATGWNRTNIWAPELHYIDGAWYIYYAGGSDGPPFIHQHAGVLAASTSDPQGAYVDKGMLYTGDDVAADTNNVWSIDLTVDTIAGQLYAIWSGWTQNATTDRTPQNLYIARMSDPTTIASNRVEIAAPTASWELGTELSLEEGPEVLHHAGNVFVIYSTNESWLPAYKLGQLRLTSGADPMNPASWTKSGPVFVGTSDVYGVGHASFTTSPDSTEDWIVYHSKVSASPGWDRVVRMQRFGWNPDGSPDFGTPVPNGQLVNVPSGQCAK